MTVSRRDGTSFAKAPAMLGISAGGFAFRNDEIADMQGAIDAVCAELGVARADHARREAIAGRVMSSYQDGRRHPLNLVAAGLGG